MASRGLGPWWYVRKLVFSLRWMTDSALTGAFNTGGGRGLDVPSLVGNAPQDMVAGESQALRSRARHLD
jgi:hypothetical protein